MIVQTDKPVYKPGDNVKFRVLVIDKDSKPYQFKKALITFSDANKNNVEKRGIPRSLNGFYQASFVLSSEALIGMWGIHVQVDNDAELISKTFEVKEYTRPRFEAVIKTKLNIPIEQESLQATFYARYSFGEYVQGEARINVKVFENQMKGTPKLEFNRTLSDVSSEEDLTLSFEDDLQISEIKKAFVKLSLVFEENLTKVERSTEKIISINSGNNQIKAGIEILGEKYFKPGFPYNFRIIIRDQSGDPIPNSEKELKITTVFLNKSNKNCGEISTVDKYVRGENVTNSVLVVDGIARLNIKTTNDNNALRFELVYDDYSLGKIEIYRFPSRSREYLKARVTNLG